MSQRAAALATAGAESGGASPPHITTDGVPGSYAPLLQPICEPSVQMPHLLPPAAAPPVSQGDGAVESVVGT